MRGRVVQTEAGEVECGQSPRLLWQLNCSKQQDDMYTFWKDLSGHV